MSIEKLISGIEALCSKYADAVLVGRLLELTRINKLPEQPVDSAQLREDIWNDIFEAMSCMTNESVNAQAARVLEKVMKHIAYRTPKQQSARPADSREAFDTWQKKTGWKDINADDFIHKDLWECWQAAMSIKRESEQPDERILKNNLAELLGLLLRYERQAVWKDPHSCISAGQYEEIQNKIIAIFAESPKREIDQSIVCRIAFEKDAGDTCLHRKEDGNYEVTALEKRWVMWQRAWDAKPIARESSNADLAAATDRIAPLMGCGTAAKDMERANAIINWLVVKFNINQIEGEIS